MDVGSVMNKVVISLILSILTFSLLGCGNTKEPMISLPADTPKETVSLINKAMPTLKEKCPGFIKYAHVLQFQEYQPTSLYYSSNGKDATVTWVLLKVPNNDKVIPTKYRCWGHTLYVGFEETGQSIILKKSETQKVFLDKDFDNGGSDYVISISK